MSGRKTTPAVYICGDGPGSYGYEGHACQRKGCHHYRIDHEATFEDRDGARTGKCRKGLCKCEAFEELP